jgi:hypothetical protein
MAKKQKTSKSKSTRKPTSFEDLLRQHESAPPTSSAPLPTRFGVNGESAPPESESVTLTPFSLPIPTHIPRHLKSSPSYLAQQSLKRKRAAKAVNEDLDDLFARVKSKSQKMDEMEMKKEADASETVDAKSTESVEAKAGNGRRRSSVELLNGIHEAADHGVDNFSDEDELASSASESCSSSSSSSSSEPSPSLLSSSSSSSTETETASEADESPSLRLQRNHSNAIGDAALTSRRRSSVATRNPPPPELEGQFKYNNSIVGGNIYRYPKAVRDTLSDLEHIFPKRIVTYVKQNPGRETSKFIDKYAEGNEETERMLVALETAKRLIVHLAKVRLVASGKPLDKGMAEELMKIAKNRGDEVDALRMQVAALRAQMQEMRQNGKKRRS